MIDELTDLSAVYRDNGEETASLLTAAGVEMKNILAVLQMAAGLLQPSAESFGNPRLDSYAAMISHCYYSLLRLANNLGDFGDLQHRRSPREVFFFDIVSAGRALVESSAHLVRDSGIGIRFESNEDALFIHADKPLLERMLLNLLANSLKNIGAGGTVTVSVMSAGDRVVLSVADNGKGISGELLSTVWRRYAEPKEYNEQAGGIGLGLTIVRHIARLHGGSVVLESREGEGTTVTVSLPAAKPESTDIGTPETEEGIYQLLTELSGAVGYEKYTPLYMD